MDNILTRALSYFQPKKQPQPPQRPEEGRWYSGAREDYSIDSSIRRSLTPAKLGDLINEANQGSTASQYELFEIVEQDDQVSSVVSKRRRAVSSRKLLIEPAIEDDGSQESKMAQEAADLCSEVVFGKWGTGGIANMSQAVYDLTDAIAKGFSLAQIVWTRKDGLFAPECLERWPQKECQLGDPDKFYMQDRDTVRVITDVEAWRGEELQKYQWVLHTQKEWSQPLARAALMRSVVWFYLFKRASWRDWMIFGEKFGMPTRVGKYHAGANDTEKAALWNAVKSLGTDAACLVPENSTIEFIEAKGSAGSVTLPFPELIKFCNQAISTAVLGNPMTTNPGEKGARSLGEVYERGEDEIAKSDASSLAETLRRDLITPIVGFNLGWDYPVPSIQFVFDQVVDLDKQSQRDERLVKMGLPIAKSYFYETYGIPTPSEDDELLETPKPPAATPPAGKMGAMGGDGSDDGEDEDDAEEMQQTEETEAEEMTDAKKELSDIISDALMLATEKKKIKTWLERNANA